MGRRFTLLALVSVLVLGSVAPALATKPDGAGDHKVTICHATGSATNPYVTIDIDDAAWADSGQVRHSPDHHSAKAFRDEVAVGGECDSGGPTGPSGPTDT